METERFNPTPFADVIEEHKAWLRDFEPVRLQNWDKIFKADPEAAIVEACARKLLAEHVERIEPAEGAAKKKGGPDFVCFQRDQHFYVEVTCITQEKVTRETGLSLSPTEAEHFQPMTRAVFQECISKATQCSGLDAPSLLLIGTLHPAGSLCFNKHFLKYTLIGTPRLEWTANLETGQTIEEPHQVTSLESSAFLKPDNDSSDFYEFARKSISGLLCCGFGSMPPVVNGVIHPNAARPFDKNLLPGIIFGILQEDPKGHLQVVWD